MTSLIIDTNRYIDLCRGDETTATLVSHATVVRLPFVVVAELRAGFAAGTRASENEATLRNFLTLPNVDVVFATDATTRVYASLYRQLRAQGTPIPTTDLWIAALTLEHNAVLLTRDAHFRHLPQIICG